MDDLFPTHPSGSSRAGVGLPACDALVLTRAHVTSLLSHADCLEAVASGFRACARDAARAPAPMHISVAAGGFHAKGAWLDASHRRVAVKINSNFPDNPQRHRLPTIQGAIALFDADNGRLLALMDSIEITLRRTAAATALAARYLARPDAATVAVCGCGEQARAQLAALGPELAIDRVYAWDRDPVVAQRFAADMNASLGVPVQMIAEMRVGTLASDVIVTATTARVPFLGPDDVRPGTFIAAVGADHPQKSEIAPELMAGARVFVDVREQCAAMGDLHHAVAAGAMTMEDVRADLAELVTGSKPGRGGADEITIFDSTGTAVEDVAAASAVFERALRSGIGLPIRINQAGP